MLSPLRLGVRDLRTTAVVYEGWRWYRIV